MPTHIVESGECLSSIAARYGHKWQRIWDDPENAELRQARKDPNVLHPGDRVFVPDRVAREESRDSEKRHRFSRNSVPAVLRVRLLRAGTALADAPYDLFVDDVHITSARTTEDGMVETTLPPAARRGTLRLPREKRVLDLELGALDPVTETSGIQARLYNLGYDPGPIDGISGPLTRAAVRSFQATYGLTADGIPGPITQRKLRELHGA